MSTVPRPDVSEVSVALHDLGTSAKQVAIDAKDAAAVTADKAVVAASDGAAKVRDLAGAHATKVRRRQRKATAKAQHNAAKAQQQTTKAARRAHSTALTAGVEVANVAAQLLGGASPAANTVAAKAESLDTSNKRSHRVLKLTGLLVVTGVAVAGVRTLRPKQTAMTGSSIPPKVRPVPVPSEAPASPSAQTDDAQG